MSSERPARTRRYEVPIGVEIATQWAWRLLLLAAAGIALLKTVQYFSEITVPLTVAVLVTALSVGAVDWMERRGVHRLLATFVVLLSMIAVVAGLIYLVAQQASAQFEDLRQSVIDGLNELEDWAHDGPLHLTDDQLEEFLDTARSKIATAGEEQLVDKLAAIGLTVTKFVTGCFVALFASIFFLYEGDRIWAWIVRLFPKAARDKVDSSGHRAWLSLTNFVRATVFVAMVDAIGIALGAVLLGVPLAFAIGVLVFMFSFIPIVGAFASGMVAVLIALVDGGPWIALAMLGVVVAVQQLESHVLQPFVMGRFVAVHPLAIILAIAAGITVSGVVGALVAVPLVAAVNGVVRHLAEQAETEAAAAETEGSTAAATEGEAPEN